MVAARSLSLANFIPLVESGSATCRKGLCINKDSYQFNEDKSFLERLYSLTKPTKTLLHIYEIELENAYTLTEQCMVLEIYQLSRRCCYGFFRTTSVMPPLLNSRVKDHGGEVPA